MMIEMLQHERAQDAIPKIEALKKLKEEIEKEQLRKQEVTKIREILSRQDKRGADATMRLRGPRSDLRWQRMYLDNAFRAPSLFTWRF